MQNKKSRPLFFSNIAKVPGPPACKKAHRIQGGCLPFFYADKSWSFHLAAEQQQQQQRLHLPFLADWDSELFLPAIFYKVRADKTSGTEVNKPNCRPSCGILFCTPSSSWVTEYNCQTSTFASTLKWHFTHLFRGWRWAIWSLDNCDVVFEEKWIVNKIINGSEMTCHVL